MRVRYRHVDVAHQKIGEDSALRGIHLNQQFLNSRELSFYVQLLCQCRER